MLDIFRKNFLLGFLGNFCVVWVVARLEDSSMQEDSEEEKPAGAVPCWRSRKEGQSAFLLGCSRAALVQKDNIAQKRCACIVEGRDAIFELLNARWHAPEKEQIPGRWTAPNAKPQTAGRPRGPAADKIPTRPVGKGVLVRTAPNPQEPCETKIFCNLPGPLPARQDSSNACTVLS
eukprot:COSAG01_NODE_16563_length_1225_cov_31.895204_1_plen_176_part_00